MYISITQLPELTFKNANPSKRKIQIKEHNFSAFVCENFNFRILMRSDALWEDAHSSSAHRRSLSVPAIIRKNFSGKSPDLEAKNMNFFQFFPLAFSRLGLGIGLGFGLGFRLGFGLGFRLGFRLRVSVRSGFLFGLDQFPDYLHKVNPNFSR